MILDSSAVVALLLHEPESDAFLKLIQQADAIQIAAPTLLECEIVIGAMLGAEGVVRLDELMMALGAHVIPFAERELAIARLAYRTYGKGRHPASLNFGDCFSYAAAITQDEPLLFKGEDFAKTDVASAAPR
ncbi:MAG TPA: type II toxin-antitoxin system VapC family toxin [Candidatus Baltobacteraceae bacterium]|nr:type II toxin-antitoxin system VapC family toxin [Candidatus Baltobacteraceae bacterium]